MSRSHADGFTLLELLVVMSIIVITMSMALMAAPQPEQRMREELTRIRGVFALAASAAILDAREWGVRFSRQGYEFLVRDDENHWRQPSRAEKLLQPGKWPPHAILCLRVEGAELHAEMEMETNTNGLPQVIFSADGQMTPFQLELTPSPHDGKQSVVLRLTGGMSGKLRLERVNGT